MKPGYRWVELLNGPLKGKLVRVRQDQTIYTKTLKGKLITYSLELANDIGGLEEIRDA